MNRFSTPIRGVIAAAAVMASMHAQAFFGGGARSTSDFTPVGEDDPSASTQAAFAGEPWSSPWGTVSPAPPGTTTGYASAGAAGPGNPWATAGYGATRPAGPLDTGSPFTWTYDGVDVGQGLTRAYSHSTTGAVNGPGTIASEGILNVVDYLNIQGGPLTLSLSINGSWLTQVATAAGAEGDMALGSGAANLLVGISLTSTFDCPMGGSYRPECKTWSMQIRADSTFGPDYDGTVVGASRYQWETQQAQSAEVIDAHLGSSVDETRSLTLGGVDPGRYMLRYWLEVSSRCEGSCDALVDFSHTGYAGVVGDFSSENGYGYARVSSVPEPQSAALLGCGLAAIFLARRRRGGMS